MITELADTTRIVRLFGALANPHRLAIFERLRQAAVRCCEGERGEMCVYDIAEGMNISLSTVSHHLKELKEACLVICKKGGQWVYCAVNAEAIAAIERFLRPRPASLGRRRSTAFFWVQ